MMLRRGTRVLDIGDGAVRVGLRPGVVLRGLSPAERHYVERLEHGAPVSRQLRERHARLLQTLVDAGALYDPPEPSAWGTAAITDAGEVGLACGEALARADAGICFADRGHASTAAAGTYSPSASALTRQGAAVSTLKASQPLARVRAGTGDADFWVLIAHGAPDLASAVTLLAHDVPHLFVTTDERGAIVGPMVIPGRGPCGWCEGSARTAVDPTWPRQALQLSAPGSPAPHVGPDVAAAIASLAAGVWVALTSGDADAWLGTQWVLTEGAPPMTRTLAPDAACGCGASNALGDEVAARRVRFPGAPAAV
jgi:hypothetical protein